MSDIYELPNNDAHYYRKAQNLIEQQRYLEAAELLEKSYAIEPNLEVFEELVKLYLTFQLNEPLKKLWEAAYPHPHDIYTSELVSHLYGLSVPVIHEADQALIELYRLKDIAKQANWQTEHLVKGITLLNEQQLFERTVTKAISPEEVNHLIGLLLAQGSLNFLTKVKWLYQMPLDQITVLLNTILQHPKVENYIKSDILHFFISQKVTGTHELLWFGQAKSVVIEELQPYKEHPAYQRTLEAIQGYCEQQNPHLYQDILHQFTLHAMVFYPFLEDIIPHGNEWLNLFLLENGLEEEETDIDPRLNHYYQLANKELNELLYS